MLAAKELVSTGKVELSADSEGVIRAGGENPDIATYTIVGATSLKKITGFRLTTVKVNKKGAGRAAQERGSAKEQTQRAQRIGLFEIERLALALLRGQRERVGATTKARLALALGWLF